jgi:HEPN domain-containing protein
MHDLVCFCCQQTVEKYLKGLLEEGGLIVPRTHDLEDLLDRLIPIHPSLSCLRRGLKFLIQFAVDARYPGFSATKRQARAALHWADRVRTAARSLLGIMSRPRRFRKAP